MAVVLVILYVSETLSLTSR